MAFGLYLLPFLCVLACPQRSTLVIIRAWLKCLLIFRRSSILSLIFRLWFIEEFQEESVRILLLELISMLFCQKQSFRLEFRLYSILPLLTILVFIIQLFSRLLLSSQLSFVLIIFSQLKQSKPSRRSFPG